MTDNRIKAAVCRLLLATVPMNSRMLVRLLYDEDTLERVCEYSTGPELPLRCYATGLLSVGLRDRSIADIVVNHETPTKFLKRARLYASKLEKERQVAMKYIQDNLRNAGARHKKTTAGSHRNAGQANLGSQTQMPRMSGIKRKHPDANQRSTVVVGDNLSSEQLNVQAEEKEEEDNQEVPDQSGDVEQALGFSVSSLGEDDPMSGAAGNTGTPPDPNLHEEDPKRLVMLEILYTLDCIGSLGEYLELFAPALKEDIIGTIITFLHSKNPSVLSNVMKLTSHFLAHKKFSISFIESGGVELIFATNKVQQALGQFGLLDRSISMCLHGFASSAVVIEKILSVDHESLLSLAFGLLSSPNDRARQNAVVFFGLTLPFKIILDYFERKDGLYTLLNLIRAGNSPKSAAQRQLSHDACLCLRQYLRVHMALVAHRLRRKLAQLNHPSSSRPNMSSSSGIALNGLNQQVGQPVLTAAAPMSRLPARVPKISWSKPIDVDDKAHESNIVFYEKYRFSVCGSGGGNAWSAASAPGGGMWSPAAKLSHLRGILVMLEIVSLMSSFIQSPDADDQSSSIRLWTVERSQFCLEALRVLTLVVPALATEVCTTEVLDDEDSGHMRLGMTILLDVAMSTNPRDSDLVRDALRVFCNCVSPPHGEGCWQHPYKDIRQYALTARSMRTRIDDQGAGATGTQGPESSGDHLFLCCSKVKDDKALRPVRKLARERNAIKVCVQLLRYKRSVQNADGIRLLATRALLGLSRDRQIAQILEKMQLGQLLSDLIRNEPVLEENADLHLRFRESALDLISQVTHRAPNTVINEATDPTVRKIEKARIVAQTEITYDPNELLRLIHDHLVANGLTNAASALVKEAKIDGGKTTSNVITPSPGAGLNSPRVKPSVKNSDLKDRLGIRVRAATDGVNRHTSGYSSNDESQRPSKVQRLSTTPDAKRSADGFSMLSHPSVSAIKGKQTKDVIAAKSLNAGANMLQPPSTHSVRRKRIRQALRSESFFQSASALSTTSKDATCDTRSRGVRSKLDEMITHYLREQHRQCSNPVTTVPPFKLLAEKSGAHHCPDPPSTGPSNICTRLLNRSRAGYRYGSRVFSSAYADAGINRYVFSRYRPYRVVGTHGSSDWGGVTVARFFGRDQQELIMANHHGELRHMHIESDSIVNEWTCHSASSAIIDLETNESSRLGSQNRLLLTGALAMNITGVSKIALWDVNNMESARWRFSGGFSPRFNHYGDQIVCLDSRASLHREYEEDERGLDVQGALVLDIATGSVLSELKDPMRSNDYGVETNCCFSPCDGTILTDGMLWDARVPARALYKFDKLSNTGYGLFHPGGNEVIVNSAVWDLRTYRLLRMVPALDKCRVKFNPLGNTLYAYHPYAGVSTALVFLLLLMRWSKLLL